MRAVKRTATGIKPTLTDHDVMQFCKTGYLALEGVIPDSTNEWVLRYLERENSNRSGLVKRERFVEEVFLHSEVAGVARSLLGNNFVLPERLSNHRLVGPKPIGRWHMDAGSQFERTCDLLLVFYVPQTNTKEMGPTYFLPGSHLVPISREELEHFGHIIGQVQTTAPAGTVLFTHHSIWHRQAAKTDQSTRNLLKWNYWRTVPPARDWIVDPEFSFGTADYTLENSEYFTSATRRWQSVPRVAEMFCWLSGQSEHFRWFGGNGWPYNHSPSGLLKKEGWMANGH